MTPCLKCKFTFFGTESVNNLTLLLASGNHFEYFHIVSLTCLYLEDTTMILSYLLFADSTLISKKNIRQNFLDIKNIEKAVQVIIITLEMINIFREKVYCFFNHTTIIYSNTHTGSYR